VLVRAPRRLAARRVRLRGRVDPGGEPTRYRFQWGTGRRLGHLTRLRRIGAARAVAVAATIAGLRPHTTYRFRLLATNAAGTSRSRVRAFRTGG
jgi:phosphodiesterase/alkaline phosphatase D-like protein